MIMFSVAGTPVPQGSMVIMKGRIRHSDSDRLNGWRNDVAGECAKAMRIGDLPQWKPWEGPMALVLYFHYQGSPGVPKSTAPDLDKLVRAVLDALTGVLYVDDKQVTRINCRKVYGADKSGLVVTAEMDT